MVADVKQSRPFLNASLLQNWLNRLGPVLGLMLVLFVVGAPEGIIGLVRRLRGSRKRGEV